MTKILIVYYSLTGNTQFIAETLRDTIEADILELKPIKELKADSGTRFMWGGFQSTMKKKPELMDFDINPLAYDLIILGTPVWAWNISPPMRSFLSKFDLTNKKVALWMCHAGDGIKAMGRFKETLKSADIVENITFQEPLKKESDKNKEKAIAWIKEVALKV
ncbi:MAG: NAD(P)H-dependent oxidoreductase [Candidatus Lokiarchaeota archaeon]|nr:NAD(P)H-dependent oxidoreductase [Candidatus Lokiarchaeota archaeon]